MFYIRTERTPQETLHVFPSVRMHQFVTKVGIMNIYQTSVPIVSCNRSAIRDLGEILNYRPNTVLAVMPFNLDQVHLSRPRFLLK